MWTPGARGLSCPNCILPFGLPFALLPELDSLPGRVMALCDTDGSFHCVLYGGDWPAACSIWMEAHHLSALCGACREGAVLRQHSCDCRRRGHSHERVNKPCLLNPLWCTCRCSVLLLQQRAAPHRGASVISPQGVSAQPAAARCWCGAKHVQACCARSFFALTFVLSLCCSSNTPSCFLPLSTVWRLSQHAP